MLNPFKKRDKLRYESVFDVDIVPVFNESGFIEFICPPTGGHMLLHEAELYFFVDIPNSHVIDNWGVYKFFENIEIWLNHTSITSKCSDSDYALTKVILDRTNFSEDILQSTGNLRTYFGPVSNDARFFKATGIQRNGQGEIIKAVENTNAAKRREIGMNIPGNTTHKRYYLTMRLNHGFINCGRPISKEIPIRIRLYRAPAEKALLGCYPKTNVADPEYEPYPTRTIQIEQPILKCQYIKSEYYDKKFERRNIPRYHYDYEDYSIHHHLLTNGLESFHVPIADGVLPKTIVFAFLNTKSFSGSFKTSNSRFTSEGLDEFDVHLNSKSITNFPLRRSSDGNYLELYYRFLKVHVFLTD